MLTFYMKFNFLQYFSILTFHLVPHFLTFFCTFFQTIFEVRILFTRVYYVPATKQMPTILTFSRQLLLQKVNLDIHYQCRKLLPTFSARFFHPFTFHLHCLRENKKPFSNRSNYIIRIESQADGNS